MEVHICPIKMRTVKFIEGLCESKDIENADCDDCPTDHNNTNTHNSTNIEKEK